MVTVNTESVTRTVDNESTVNNFGTVSDCH
jgi:hypothetical protein